MGPIHVSTQTDQPLSEVEDMRKRLRELERILAKHCPPLSTAEREAATAPSANDHEAEADDPIGDPLTPPPSPLVLPSSPSPGSERDDAEEVDPILLEGLWGMKSDDEADEEAQSPHAPVQRGVALLGDRVQHAALAVVRREPRRGAGAAAVDDARAAGARVLLALLCAEL